ncbi:efflux RND transporter periplasmic adaptor subunit [Tabrizicola sp. BL-A-41-H6]|uniref:efflux RND transporter periplasmic adaptor subunit n=1 Tax=Tabrizicola sp. BL-A-41-H6 TaxID=3421107 RepID=UPI003D66DA9C
MRLALIALPWLILLAQEVSSETLSLSPTTTTEWKAVYGRIEARDRVPARVRIGGTVVELTVTEGDVVREGELIATVIDDKLTFQLTALEARKGAQAAQLANAETELARGEQLLKQGVSTVQRLDGLRTQVEVLKGQIASVEAEMELIRQTQNEGRVLAPAGGRVLDVPVSTGAVVMPGEPVALISVGGTFLRLAVPERHAAMLQEGAAIRVEGVEGVQEGRLIKVYPLIENGRVIADVEVQGAPDRFVDARVLVRLPMQEREALFVPVSALISRGGLDFVQVETDAGPTLRTVVPGQRSETDQGEVIEILTGLATGDRVVTDPKTGASHE